MKHLVALILALLMALPLSIMAGASAASVTSPLEDLKKCEGFNQEDYPAEEGSGTLQVIHAAETVDDELLLYVYAPGQVRATHAVISLTDEGKEVDFNEYALTHTASDGVFQKYIVNGLTVDASKVTRSYEVASILRPFDAALGDKAPTDDNTIHEVAYEVGKMWTYVSGQGQYVVNQRSVITVTKKHVGFIRYNEHLLLADTDSHFVAFSTDKKIDKLLSVDMSYKTVEMTYLPMSDGTMKPLIVGERGESDITLTAEQVVKKDTLFGGYEYERIQRTADFVKREDLTDATKNALVGTEWVLRFFESSFCLDPLVGAMCIHCTDVTEVLLLRMEFETDGVTYNMGVVDDKTSGDTTPDNKDKPDWLLMLVIVLVVLILLGPVFNVLGPILKALVWLVLLPFKVLWWLVKAVVKGIVALFNKQ